MFKLISLLLLVIVTTIGADIIFQKSTSDFIIDQGYSATSYDITTEDGYILKLFYMPLSEHCTTSGIKKAPVLLMHGHLSCSDFAVLNATEKALAFLLADDCHPVYLGNARSNIYSQRHVTLSKYNPEFWNFSYNEIGLYDIAAMLNRIKQDHPGTRTHYVGHSQGCAELLVLLSSRPQYKSLVDIAVLLAPAGFMHHSTSPLFAAAGLKLGCNPYLSLNGNWLENNFVTQLVGEAVCEADGSVCNFFTNVLFGWSNQIDESLIPEVLINHPAGNSVKELQHLMQGFCDINEDFRNFNMGPVKNLIKYQSLVPPAYDFSSIETPIVIIHGAKDTVTAPADVKTLISHLPNVQQEIELPFYNHLDVIWGATVRENVNEKIRKVFSN